MYGDPDRLLALATSIEQHADDVRDQARAMVGRAAATRWVGIAADRHRTAVDKDAAAFDNCAGRLDEAAVALRAHARRVADMIELIAAAERKVTSFVDGLAHESGHLLDDVEHAVSSSWSSIELPASGSKDWLALADRLDGHRAGAG